MTATTTTRHTKPSSRQQSAADTQRQMLGLIKRQAKQGTTALEMCQALKISADTCKNGLGVLRKAGKIDNARGVGNIVLWYVVGPDLDAGTAKNAAEVKAAAEARDIAARRRKAQKREETRRAAAVASRAQQGRPEPKAEAEDDPFADEVDRDPVIRSLVPACEAEPLGAVGASSVFDWARWVNRKAA